MRGIKEVVRMEKELEELIELLEQAAEEGIINCPRCGAPLEPDAERCGECGFPNPLIELGFI